MGPLIRIILRYGVGAIIGYEVASNLAADPDVVAVATVAAASLAGAVTEYFYIIAKKFGWRT
jgi:uncharacterized membrane protein